MRYMRGNVQYIITESLLMDGSLIWIPFKLK